MSSDDEDFWELVGSESKPGDFLARMLSACGQTKFKREDDVFVVEGEICPNLETVRSEGLVEMFCIECGITCEIDIIDEPFRPSGDGSDTSDMDDFLSIVGTRVEDD